METLVSKALIIRLSLQPAPASETSAFNNILAFSSRCAGLLPLRINASSRSRSSPLRRSCCDRIESQNHSPFKLIEASDYVNVRLGALVEIAQQEILPLGHCCA